MMRQESKYEKMRKDILAKILTGQFPDKRLPSIKQLADSYNVSLMTANRAVKLLEETGIVQCCPGNVGTVIDEKKAALLNSQADSKHIWPDLNIFIEEQVRIKFLCCYTANDSAIWKEIDEQFNREYPWVGVDIFSTEKVPDYLRTRGEYDVIQLSGRDVSSYSRKNHLMDITDLADETLDRGAFLPNTLEQSMTDEKLFGLPMTISTPLLFFNRKYFGKQADALSRDWDAFLNSQGKAMARGSYVAFNLGLASLLHYFIGDIHNLTRATFDKDALIKLVKILKYISLNAPNGDMLKTDIVYKNFLSRKVSLFGAYSFTLGKIIDECGFDWGVSPLPTMSTGGPLVETTVNGINPRSEYKKEAWLFIRFLSSPIAQAIFCRNRKYIPATRTAFDETYAPQDPATAEILRNIIEKAQFSTVSSQTLYTIYSCIHPMLEAYYAGHCQAENLVERIISRVREILALEFLTSASPSFALKKNGKFF